MKKILGAVLLCQFIIEIKWVLCSSVSRGDYGEVRLFRTPASYDVETTVMLNDLSKKDKEVGYKIKAKLHVHPVWSDASTEFLLKFSLDKPKLHLRGKHINADFRPFDSVWDSNQQSDFYAHLKSGLVHKAYLDSNELVDFLNYKKSLISLFQFQIFDGEYNETDISGSCDVLYESISENVFRKIKKACDKGAGVVSARRVARYTLGADSVAEVYADELVELGGAELGVKARSWHRLRPAPPAPRPAPPAPPGLAAALRALPETLRPEPLTMPDGDDVDDDLTLEQALKENAAALETEEAGAGGRASDARAALRLLPALRAAPAPALRALLEAAAAAPAAPALRGTCRMLGLAGSAAAHAAADGFLHLSARDPLQPLARDYLAGAALAPAPAPAALAALGRLAGRARGPGLAGAALLAAAAAAARLPGDPSAGSLRDHLARSLARCKDDGCRAVRLRALGHLRRADSAELLLEHAGRGGRGAALAALGALAALPAGALHLARRRRLEALALRPGAALEVRALALDLLLKSSVERPLPLAETAAVLHRHGPIELRRLFWQRLAALAEQHEPVAALLPRLPAELRAWPAQAHAGTSMALARPTGWAGAGWAAQLDTLQVAARGLLRRGSVSLQARSASNSTEELLSVSVWTRGLEAIAGGSEPADPALYEAEEEGEPAGGLELAVGGVHLPPISLFEGQAELLGHVWAGTGSAPTPVLRALLPREARAHVPLLAGVRARARSQAALALALDAHAAVSLWSRSARAELELRAGGAAEAELALRTAWGALAARATAQAEPRLRISADLDFYDGVALCVRVRTDDYVIEREGTQQSSLGARPLRVTRSRSVQLRAPGRTLALGRAPVAACRAHAPPPAD